MMFASLLAVGSFGVASAQVPTAESLKQTLAQRTMDLGVCHIQLGVLEQLSSQVIGGALMTADQWRSRFEAANPGKTVDATFAVAEKNVPVK